jgi:hypothetical protein
MSTRPIAAAAVRSNCAPQRCNSSTASNSPWLVAALIAPPAFAPYPQRRRISGICTPHSRVTLPEQTRASVESNAAWSERAPASRITVATSTTSGLRCPWRIVDAFVLRSIEIGGIPHVGPQARPACKSVFASDGEIRVREDEWRHLYLRIGRAVESRMEFANALTSARLSGKAIGEQIARLVLQMLEAGHLRQTFGWHVNAPFMCCLWSAVAGRKVRSLDRSSRGWTSVRGNAVHGTPHNWSYSRSGSQATIRACIPTQSISFHGGTGRLHELDQPRDAHLGLG